MPTDDDLDALVKRTDPDRWLSSRFVAEPALRADVVALYAFDHELARAPQVASNPILGEIRLTWWRDALDEVFAGGAVRRHPGVEALAAAVRGRGIRREPLEAMIDARYRELDATPMDAADAIAWAEGTAGAAAETAAAILDPGVEAWRARTAGAAWALAHRMARQPELAAVFAERLTQARRDAPGLGVSAFPAVAHAALAEGRARGTARGELSRRLRLTWAVARGRI